MKGICLHEKQGHTGPRLIALKTLIYIEVLRFFVFTAEHYFFEHKYSNIYRLYTKS